HPERLDAHVAEVDLAFGSFEESGEHLDLVTDLLVAGEVAWAVAVFQAKLARGLALGGEILGLGPLIHHLRGQMRDLPPDAFVSHGEGCADLGPSKRRWASRRVESIDAAALGRFEDSGTLLGKGRFGQGPAGVRQRLLTRSSLSPLRRRVFPQNF